MSRTSPRALALAAVSAVALSVSVTPASAATSKAEKRQNAAIKKTTTTAKKAGTTARRANRNATAAAASATKAINDAKKANDGVGAINTTVVPAALKALGDLRDGLLALKTGLEAAGAGLTKLAAFTAADEYGVVQIASGSSGALGPLGEPIPGCFYETGNIPDNVQDAIVTGTCLVPNAVPAGDAVRILTGIRSNESDGVATPTAVAAGVAGIVAYTQTGVATGGPAAGAVIALGGGATIPAGAGLPPAVTIPLKSAPTSTTETSFPFGPISTDKLVDLATTQFSGTPTPPVFGNPATTANRSITFTVRFNDLTPDANDPTA